MLRLGRADPRPKVVEKSEASKKPEKKKPVVYINLHHTHYDVVRQCAEKRGWQVCDDDDGKPWNVFWTDLSVLPDRVMSLLPYQKINHFSGTRNIARKNLMGTNLNLFNSYFPREYDFYPRTWVLPNERHELERHFVDGVSPDVIICKPDGGCQGRGIVLTRKLEKIDFAEEQIAQIYINRPLLLYGYKFDLRIYVLVYSCDPLRLYLFKDGLVRSCSNLYDKNCLKHLGNAHIHLTNYAVNKEDAGFDLPSDIPDIGRGTKRSLQWLAKYFEMKGLSFPDFWERMRQVITKTLLTIQPILAHTYHTCLPSDTSGTKCFELLGFDILVDQNLKPWLMEVNHSPSFGCDSELDQVVKEKVIDTVMDFANISIYDRQRYQKMQQEESKNRLYKSVSRGEDARQKIDRRDEDRRDELEDIHKDKVELLYPPQNPALQALYNAILEKAEALHGRVGERLLTPRSLSRSYLAAGSSASTTPTPSPREAPRQCSDGTPRAPPKTMPGKELATASSSSSLSARKKPQRAPKVTSTVSLEEEGEEITPKAATNPVKRSSARSSAHSAAPLRLSSSLEETSASDKSPACENAGQDLPGDSAMEETSSPVAASPPLKTFSVVPPRSEGSPLPFMKSEKKRSTPISASSVKVANLSLLPSQRASLSETSSHTAVCAVPEEEKTPIAEAENHSVSLRTPILSVCVEDYLQCQEEDVRVVDGDADRHCSLPGTEEEVKLDPLP